MTFPSFVLGSPEWLTAALALCPAAMAHAQAPARGLADLSLEQLSNIVVSTVSRREEPLSRAPASIYVITADDIRRSGATSLPEALRLAPNLQVALHPLVVGHWGGRPRVRLSHGRMFKPA